MTASLWPTKRDMGSVYLVVVGLLFVAIVVRQAFQTGISSLEDFLLLLFGFLFTLGLVGVGVWLFTGPLDDERVLLVSEWGALGIAIATGVIAFGILFVFPFDPTPGLFVTTIGAGGIVGTLIGSVQALEAEHGELNRLYGRNQVLQRVLRHNIRNGMTVVRGYAELLEEDLEGTRVDMIRTIRQEAGSIVDLSERAQNLQTAERQNHRHPMNLSTLVNELLDGLRRNYPTGRVDTDVPPDVYVKADNLLELALWEILEYSIRRDGDVPIHVTVTETDGTVTIAITDPGDSISEEALDALRRGSETQMEHLEGVELWVAKWLVENMDGTIEFDRRETGTTTCITLPNTTPPSGNRVELEGSPRAIES